MLKALLAKSQAFLIGSIVLAVACGVAVVAAGYGVYALSRLALSPAASAGITAVVFAVVAGVSAWSLLRIVSSKSGRQSAKTAQAADPQALKMGMDAGAAAIGFLTDIMAARREAQRGKTKSRRRASR